MLGVEGKPSRFNHRAASRFGENEDIGNACLGLKGDAPQPAAASALTCAVSVPVVSVDLSDGSMAAGGRGYQRLLTGLRWRLQLKADFLLSHHPGERLLTCAQTAQQFTKVSLL